MAACAREHAEHGGHDHHDHDHDHDDPERGEEQTLFAYIDTTKMRCFNESQIGAVKNIIRPWDQRLDKSTWVESDADEQLIIFIPFTADIKLKSITVVGGEGDQHPATVKVFKNREDIDFDTVEDLDPVQQFELQPDSNATIEHQTRISKFQNVHNLTFFFDTNFGAETTKIHSLFLKGTATKVTRQTIITIAETAANPADHKTDTKVGDGFSKAVQ
eukprot:m.196911 g.196911  ORF g.196911 m.196911 type:complete len:217 (-) comp18337_c0_seq1:44-694(-)